MNCNSSENSTILVRNVNASSKKQSAPTCQCSTSLEHWNINNSNLEPDNCPACDQMQTGKNRMVGGHVQKVNAFSGGYTLASDQRIYVVPICDSCNKRDGLVFEIDRKYLTKSPKEDCIMP